MPNSSTTIHPKKSLDSRQLAFPPGLDYTEKPKFLKRDFAALAIGRWIE